MVLISTSQKSPQDIESALADVTKLEVQSLRDIQLILSMPREQRSAFTQAGLKLKIQDSRGFKVLSLLPPETLPDFTNKVLIAKLNNAHFLERLAKTPMSEQTEYATAIHNLGSFGHALDETLFNIPAADRIPASLLSLIHI